MNKKVVIVDADKELAESLKLALETTSLYTVVETLHSGENADKLIESASPDLVILDLILPDVDGLAVLEKLAPNKTAKILVLSALSQDTFVQRAMKSGADFFMMKPFNMDILLERINDLSKTQRKVTRPLLSVSAQHALEERISNIFITVGIPAHIKGYQFLREAIRLAVDNPEIINCITKKLYPTIAEKFETSSSKVERAIRHAIEVAWNRGKIENINTLFGIRIYNNNEKPTNGEFIALVADKMLIEGNNGSF